MASVAVATSDPVGTRPSAPAQSVKALFYVTAVADPGVLSRLIDPVAMLGYVPARVHASRESGDGSEISVDLRLKGVSTRGAELVENALRRVIGVRQVIAVVEADD